MLFVSLSLLAQYLGLILSGTVFLWIQSANSLAGQFNKAMEIDYSKDNVTDNTTVEEASVQEAAE
jgi:hypothetical protein